MLPQKPLEGSNEKAARIQEGPSLQERQSEAIQMLPRILLLSLVLVASPSLADVNLIGQCSQRPDEQGDEFDAGDWWGQADRTVFHSVCVEKFTAGDRFDWFFVDTVLNGNSWAFARACGIGEGGVRANLKIYVLPALALVPEIGGQSVTGEGQEALGPFQRDEVDISGGCGQVHGGGIGASHTRSRIFIQLTPYAAGDNRSYLLEVRTG